jgi:hypothetical protein
MALVGAVGIETTNYMETKELCGAPWPSKRKERKRWCPLLRLDIEWRISIWPRSQKPFRATERYLQNRLVRYVDGETLGCHMYR